MLFVNMIMIASIWIAWRLGKCIFCTCKWMESYKTEE